ncbi:hypothetical protein D7322_03230 [Sphingobacterium puteale]|uniref:Uncharacterized protein n=1 Tax=Sphingobacterium puteale TaxID=2420510 RepID=A0A420W4Y9_9SPHI|nr:hypothetical protein D7322_03230 [Sphingobacterium puteale]
MPPLAMRSCKIIMVLQKVFRIIFFCIVSHLISFVFSTYYGDLPGMKANVETGRHKRMKLGYSFSYKAQGDLIMEC